MLVLFLSLYGLFCNAFKACRSINIYAAILSSYEHFVNKDHAQLSYIFFNTSIVLIVFESLLQNEAVLRACAESDAPTSPGASDTKSSSNAVKNE